jgi:hypothetical protein
VSISIDQAAIFLGSVTLTGACIGAAPSDPAPIRDGQLNYGPEEIFAAYYAYQVSKNFTVTADYHYINSPRKTPIAGRSRSSPAVCTANSNRLFR